MNESDIKSCSKIALAALFILFIGSIIFYKERILFADSAFKTFEMLRKHTFSISEYRIGSFMSQLFPFLAEKVHLPIKLILIGYSASFNFFYLVVAALLIYRYKQYALSIIMCLYYFLFVSDSYFWANDEIHQAVGWMFLCFGVTMSRGEKRNNEVLTFLQFSFLAGIAVFTHFLVVVPMLFLLLYLIIEKIYWPFTSRSSILIIVLISAIIAFCYVVTMSRSGSYDSEHLAVLSSFSMKHLIYSFSTPVIGVFIKECVVNYWLSVIIFLVSVINLIMGSKYKSATFFVLSCMGYFMLMGIAYGNLGYILKFHIETEWACLAIIISTPFVFNILPKLKPKYGVSILLLIFLVRICYIGYAAPKYKNRTIFRDEVLKQMKKKGIAKLALIYEDNIREEYIQDWAIGEESILSSTLHGDKPIRAITFADTSDLILMKALANPQVTKLSFEISSPRYLNNSYFLFDSVSSYKVMTYTELFGTP